MNKTNELRQKLKDYPEHELIFMYPDDNSDYPYTLGHPSSILVDEYCVEYERAWLRFDDWDELEDEIREALETDNQEEIDNYINAMDWKKCICVRIQS